MARVAGERGAEDGAFSCGGEAGWIKSCHATVLASPLSPAWFKGRLHRLAYCTPRMNSFSCPGRVEPTASRVGRGGDQEGSYISITCTINML